LSHAARGLNAFASTAPVTRASGMKTVVTMRAVRNKRLGQAAYLWALSLLAPRREPAPTTTDAAKPETATAPPPATSPTEASACSHCLQTSQLSTTRPKPSPPRRRPLANPRQSMSIKRARRPQPRPSLDTYQTCDVSRATPRHGAPASRTP
jgi:hypothetical protein